MDSTRPFPTGKYSQIGKYRLVRKIGTGGMGEVYLAQDTELERQVAIKLIHNERHGDRDVRHLFEKEAKATAKLQHRAIVRVYDFLRWKEHECLVMEYLEGQSFKTFLEENDNLTPERTLPIFLDIAEGLAHAHQKGFIHRDLKPGNLWVTPEGQVKIFDFGLAKHVEQETSLLDGRVVGTPYYMSPQQASGQRLDLRSDLFSFGIIFYEALTGTHPFKGESSLETLANIKGGRQVPAGEISDAIPQEISTLVDRLLAKNPAKRPDSADEVAETLATAIGRPRPRRSVAKRPRWATPGKILATVVLSVALAVATYFLPQEPDRRPSIVVLGDTGESDAWVATAVVEILSAHLGGDDALRTLPSFHSAHTPSPDALTHDALRDLRAALRVDHFVLSETLRVDDAWHVRLRLVGVRRGKVRAETSIDTTAPADELEALLEDAATLLRDALGLKALAPEALNAARASFPDGATGSFYAEGLAAHRRHEPRAARAAFEQAIASDPDAPMPHVAQVIVLTTLGELDDALAAGARAEQLADVLSDSQRHEISARNAAISGDWQAAADFHRANFERSPDLPRYGRGLAEALLYLGQADAALDMITELREISLSRLEDGRLDLVTAFAAFRLSNHSLARAAATQAVEIGEALGAFRLIAEGQLVLSMTLDLLGERYAADRAWDAAVIAAEKAGDRLILLDAFSQSIETLTRRGQIAEGLRQFQRHRELYHDAGDRSHEARMLYNLATLLLLQDPETAAPMLNEARAIYSQLGLREEEAAAEFTLGTLAQLRGRLTAAHTHYQVALRIFTELDNQAYRAAALTSLGELAFFAAELDQALDLHNQALAINSALPSPSGVAYDTFRLAEVLRHQGELESAHGHYVKSLEAREELGDVKGAAETRIGLARLELARKNFGNALTQAHEASRALLEVGAMDFFVLARITEARVYLAQGDLATARALLDEIELHTDEKADRRVGFEFNLLAARLSEDSAERSKMLEQVAAEAADGGDLLYAAEARRFRETFSTR